MKHNLFQKWTSLVLALFMVITMIPIFTLTARAENVSATLTKVELSDIANLDLNQKYVITYDSYAMKAAVASSRLSNGSFAEGTTTIDDYCIWTISQNSAGYYTLYNEATAKYAASTGAANKAQLLDNATDTKAQWTITVTDNTFEIVNVANEAKNINANLRNNGTYGFACYSTKTGGALTLYKVTTSDCTHDEKVAIGEAKAATCTEDGITAGVKCSTCGATLEEQATIPATARHLYVDGVCEVCGATIPFKVGDVVIFTGSQADGTVTQELTGFAVGAKFGTAGEYENIPAGTFPLTIVAGYESGTFAFKNGDNYITYYGEKNVNLSTTLDANSSWTVELRADGAFDIRPCSNTSHYLQYNPSSPRFTTYTGLQQPIKIVKYVAPATEPTVKSVALTLNKGVTVNVTINIPEAWLGEHVDAQVVFSNGKRIDAVAGEQVYTADLTPGQINDNLTVAIRLADDTIVGEAKDVSVVAYMTKLKVAYDSGELGFTEAKYTALQNLLDAALTYSNVADGEILADFTGAFADVEAATITNSGVLTGFAGDLGTYATIKISVNPEMVDGEQMDLSMNKLSLNGVTLSDYLSENKQIVISGLYPANFGDQIKITLWKDPTMVKFTFNSYLKAVFEATESDSVKSMAYATYLYGLAAKDYLGAQ